MSVDNSLRESVLAELRKRIDPSTFSTWCRHLDFEPAGGDRFRIPLPNEIYRQWVERQLRAPLEEAFRTALGRSVGLDFTTGAPAPTTAWPSLQPPAPDAMPLPPPPPEAAAALPPRPRFNPQYTFENFIVGPTNRLAHANALAVSESLAAPSCNPLFIHGGVGLGKTHLLQAIGDSLLRRYPNADVCYLSCEGFVNEYISAVKKRELDVFRNRFRNADVLLIDDIHFLSDKEGSQEEFFHTFNALHDANRQIVLSSDSPAKDIPDMRERLMTRFRMGLEARIDPPTYEMRVAILRARADALGKQLPDDVLEYIAGLVTTNIRELHGAVNRLLGGARLSGRRIDLAFAQETLAEGFSRRPAIVSVQEVQQAVCEQFKLKPSELLSSKRSRAFAVPRQIAMFLARELTAQSLTDIGAFFGNKDHSTVIYSIQKIRELINEDAELRATLEALRAHLQRRHHA